MRWDRQESAPEVVEMVMSDLVAGTVRDLRGRPDFPLAPLHLAEL
jgi:hypothetical protein